MDKFRPKSIDLNVWTQSTMSQNWQQSQWPLEMRILECVKYIVCCHISDMHTHQGRPRYTVLLWMPPEIRDNTMKELGIVFAEPNIPDLLDIKEKKGLFVKIYKPEEELIDNYSSNNDILLKFTIDGKSSPETKANLDQVQISDIVNFLIQFHNESLDSNLHVRLSELFSTEPIPFRVPAIVKEMLCQSSDYGLVPDTTPDGEVPPLHGERWSQMKTLPKLKTSKGPPSKWGGWLLGHESRFKVFENNTDQNITLNFLADFHTSICVRESKVTPKEVVKCVIRSLEDFSEGRKKRPKIKEDETAFGIGLKRRKKQDQELKISSSDAPWERSTFPLEEESEPQWVEEELAEMERPTDIKWLTLEPNSTYTIVDDHAKEAVDQYQEILSPYWVSALIEKMQIAATRAYNELHTDRAQITIIPIITRKEWKSLQLSQLWGYIIIGPHHIKQETDRIPIVTFELTTEDNPSKYPNHSYFQLTYTQGTDSVGQEDVLVRVTSISKHKLFTFSTIRRVYIQPCSVYSKLILKKSADKQEKDFDISGTVEIYFNGRPVAVSWKTWLIKLLCIEYLMAVHNNSQMEGFLANVRRLHMSRHAMIEKCSVFLPFGSAPEEKCNECVINNPIVNYLARTWNEMPNVYSG
ncbi:polymerase subunit [Oz virus]|uniref:Polymerase subunit n=1 Tax=Oz virus TaxID=2137161 RepID=A0A2Z6BEV6_9ORTO|nr:polymerase subunit [Oz virus]BBD20266.1 polymerase subunit [Oz virus]